MQTQLPPGRGEECRLRIRQAQESRAQVGAAAETLRKELESGASREMVEAGFDRLEAALYEWQRRGLAVSDVPGCAGGPEETAVKQAAEGIPVWVEELRASRGQPKAVQLETLEKHAAWVKSDGQLGIGKMD